MSSFVKRVLLVTRVACGQEMPVIHGIVLNEGADTNPLDEKSLDEVAPDEATCPGHKYMFIVPLSFHDAATLLYCIWTAQVRGHKGKVKEGVSGSRCVRPFF